jgi:hypothetical protein
MPAAAQRVPPRLVRGDERPAALVPRGDEGFVAQMTPRPPFRVQHCWSAEQGEPSSPVREQANCLIPLPGAPMSVSENGFHQPGGGTHPPNTKKLVELVGGSSQG